MHVQRRTGGEDRSFPRLENIGHLRQVRVSRVTRLFFRDRTRSGGTRPGSSIESGCAAVPKIRGDTAIAAAAKVAGGCRQ